MQQFGRILVRGALILLLLAALLVAGVAIAVNLSPRPFSAVVAHAFGPGGAGIQLVQPPLYAELAPLVESERDITYPSRYSANQLDVFRRRDATGPQPTLIWVHGGGFVGGDKADIATWATLVAAQGYTVVSINYATAPDTTYPAPVVQVGEVHDFLKQNASRFPTVDLGRLLMGGDSAGAQIASQFVALQTDSRLAATLPEVSRMPPEHLLGVVLYCGPYDLRGLYAADKWFDRFFIRQLGWAYFGRRDWADIPASAEATTVDHVTSRWPATFITDGNTGSFEADARKLEARLRAQDVAVDALYYPPAQAQLGHEYQFDFSLPEAMHCLERTLAFLARVTEAIAPGPPASTG